MLLLKGRRGRKNLCGVLLAKKCTCSSSGNEACCLRERHRGWMCVFRKRYESCSAATSVARLMASYCTFISIRWGDCDTLVVALKTAAFVVVLHTSGERFGTVKNIAQMNEGAMTSLLVQASLSD